MHMESSVKGVPVFSSPVCWEYAGWWPLFSGRMENPAQ